MSDQIAFDDFEPDDAEAVTRATAAALDDMVDEIRGSRSALVPMPLVDILPADVDLPALVRFVPSTAYRDAVAQSAQQALSVDVTGPGGLQAADVAVTTLRASLSALQAHFDEPRATAHKLWKSITSTIADWAEPGEAALKQVESRIWQEQQRLERLAAEKRRRDQQEANRAAREALAREADLAAKANASAAVIETLRQQAETAQAAPVPVLNGPTLAHSTTTNVWKCRLVGTEADTEPNPETADLTNAQRAAMLTLLRAIVEGKAPLAAVSVNWKAMNARAKAEKQAFAVPGLEAFATGGLRAKPGRRVR